MTMEDTFVTAGKKGGEARARNLTPEQRSKAARKAVNARWHKIKADAAATEKMLRDRNKYLETALKAVFDIIDVALKNEKDGKETALRRAHCMAEDALFPLD